MGRCGDALAGGVGLWCWPCASETVWPVAGRRGDAGDDRDDDDDVDDVEQCDVALLFGPALVGRCGGELATGDSLWCWQCADEPVAASSWS